VDPHRKGAHGFTLIELIASITIIAIIAAVTLPNVTAAQPFDERGYADGVAAALRQARAVAHASDCAVQFSINGAGYQAMQRAASGTHCAMAGPFTTPVARGDGDVMVVNRPADVVLAADVVLVFAPNGTAPGGPFSIGLGSRVVDVAASGVVSGP
jgi:prepilin-type N-terminal cleavage/methylation domain-containing protein